MDYIRKTIWIGVLLLGIMPLSAQLYRHGLVLSMSKGDVALKTDKSSGRWREYEYKSGFSAGYRLRFNKPAPRSFHYDLDLNAGMKILRSTVYQQVPEYGNMRYGSKSFHYYTSVGGTANCSIIKNLSAGLGVEPSWYFRRGKPDIPLVAKIAYSLKVIDFELSGKYGPVNVLKTDGLQSGKFRDIQCSLFIPF
jgi:hypothetical protein